MIGRARRVIGVAVLGVLAVLAGFGDHLTVTSPAAQHAGYVLAPPMLPRLVDEQGRWHAPFVHPLVLEDRLTGRYRLDRDEIVPLEWLAGGRVVSAPNWFPFGTDELGRDIYSRFVAGARLSLAVAGCAATLALCLGAFVGGAAGIAPRRMDAGLMRVADLVVALPALYVIVTLRAALPLVMTTGQTFAGMVAVLALVGWPVAARGTRAIVFRENHEQYAEAARACGASRRRILLRHLLPATRHFLAVQLTLLVPAFILAEATLSYVGLGFAEPASSWGVMLRSAHGLELARAPWLLTPAAGIAATVLALHLVALDRQGPDAPPAARL